MAKNSWPSISKIGGSGSGKWNALLNLLNHEPDTNKSYSYAKDPCGEKYQFLIKKKRKYRIKVFKWLESFYSILKWYEWYL